MTKATTAARRVRHPAAPATDPIEEQGRIGSEIRQLRTAKGLTLQELADQAQISIGLLSQLERGRSQLSVATLMRLSNVLGVPMNFFFSKSQNPVREENDIVVRASERRELRFPGTGIREDLLSPNLAGPIEMLLSTVEPGADCGEAYSHRGDEAGLILCGSLDLWVGNRHFSLNAGDSFSFPSTIPHRYRNNGSVTTNIVWIITPPFY
ncbi:MAG: XRE family transcriptional regulator [Pseudolabrys sp.]|nr:XRE family transcriptional regulator [Pseudolabrys sp.]